MHDIYRAVLQFVGSELSSTHYAKEKNGRLHVYRRQLATPIPCVAKIHIQDDYVIVRNSHESRFLLADPECLDQVVAAVRQLSV